MVSTLMLFLGGCQSLSKILSDLFGVPAEQKP